MPSAEFFLVRHGESTWNRERRMQGYADPPLTPEGLLQARALAERIEPGSIDVLVSSDLQRAILTARAISEATGLSIETRVAWREHDMGAWTGLTRPQIENQWPKEYAEYRAGSPCLRPGGGESRLAFRERILNDKRRIEEQFDGKRILIVTHRGPIRILLPQVKPAHAELLALAPEK